MGRTRSLSSLDEQRLSPDYFKFKAGRGLGLFRLPLRN
ncbi:hypothetical protein Mcup_1027 [Metallosphaera cuprina Ar-4]|uniref:Uncharacterized protein n=1 Tax=Metallosphaera cuprina (strain Ar-4) TaxID=1006006 RepID=F4G2T4_METCR|nr:hypothetical protein Mcup_1027 [Metallosphaera cuprina Ar-4]